VALIKLRHPDYEGLTFGPRGELQFGIKGGFPPGICIVDEDHPLLPSLFALEPSVQVVRDEGPAEVYVCPTHTDRTFRIKSALIAHMRGKGHDELVSTESPPPEA